MRKGLIIIERIAVVYGGDSPEREVSLNSGKAVLEGFNEAGVKAIPLKVDGPGDLLDMLDGLHPDLLFIALHGGWGENGQLQALLDLKGISYTGPGFEACALAMDKWASKVLFRAGGVPVPWGISLKGDAIETEARGLLDSALERYGRLVVKPNGGGSTVGLSIVESFDQIDEALEMAWRYDEKVLVEEFISGRELTVTVVEREGRPEAYPVIEIVPHSGFYSYESKYTVGATEYLVPAPLDEEVREVVEDAALRAYRALDCRGYSRVDLRLDSDGRPFVLEINTAPGMTATSLVPKAASARGMAFSQLLLRIAEESLIS